MKLTSNNALIACIFLSLLALIAIFFISSTQKKRLDDEARRITGIIKKNTLWIGKLVDDLLSFSRMARKDLEKITVHNNEVFRETIAASEAGKGAAFYFILAAHRVRQQAG